MLKGLFVLIVFIYESCGLGPRIYVGETSLGNTDAILTINILAGYGNDGSIRDGLNITVNPSFLGWIGIGFGTEMNGSAGIICGNNQNIPQERQLGASGSGGAGVLLTSIGNGICSPPNAVFGGTFRWALDGYNFANNIFTFPNDGSDMNIIWAYGSSQTFGKHVDKGVTTVSFQCYGDCDNTSPTQSPSYQSNNLRPRIYYGETTFGNSLFTIKMNIIAGYGTANGLNITITPVRSNEWVGIGFASDMTNAPAIICANNDLSPQERQLGTPSPTGSGLLLSSVGDGFCFWGNAVAIGRMVWTLEGYNFADNLYTFPHDGSDISIIWAYGSSITFGKHMDKGYATISFMCTGDCNTTDPTIAPSQSPTNASQLIPTMIPSQSPTNTTESDMIPTKNNALNKQMITTVWLLFFLCIFQNC